MLATFLSSLTGVTTSCKRESENENYKVKAGEFSANPIPSIPKITNGATASEQVCSGVLVRNIERIERQENRKSHVYLLTAAHCLINKLETAALMLNNIKISISNPSIEIVPTIDNICYNQHYKENDAERKAYDFAIVRISAEQIPSSISELIGYEISNLNLLGFRPPYPGATLSAQGIGAGWGLDKNKGEGPQFRFGVAFASESTSNTGLLSGKAIWIDGDSGGPFIVRRGKDPFSELMGAKNSKDSGIIENKQKELEASFLNPEGSTESEFGVVAIAAALFEPESATNSNLINKTYLIHLGSASSQELINSAIFGRNGEDGKSCYNNPEFGKDQNYKIGLPLENVRDIDGGVVGLDVIGDDQLSAVPYIGYVGNGETFCNISAITKAANEHWLVTAKHCIPLNGASLSNAVKNFCEGLEVKGKLAGEIECQIQNNKYEYRVFTDVNPENEDIIFIKARSLNEINFNSAIEINSSNYSNISFASYSAGNSTNEFKILHGYLNDGSIPFFGKRPDISASEVVECQSDILMRGMFDFSQGSSCKISGGVNNAYYHPFDTEIGESGGIVFAKIGEELKVVCVNIGRKDLFNYCLDYELPPVSILTDPIDSTEPPPTIQPPPTTNPCMTVTDAVAAVDNSNKKFTCTAAEGCNLRNEPSKFASQPNPNMIFISDGEQTVKACFYNQDAAEKIWACIQRPSGVAWVYTASSETSCEFYLQ